MRNLTRIKPSLADLANLRGMWRQHPRYKGCVAHWMFVESAGTVIHDLSGVRNNGAVVGTLTWASGQFGQSLRLGAEDYVSTTFTQQLGDFSACAWFNAQGTYTGSERIIDKAYDVGFWMGHNFEASNSWGGGIRQTTSPYGRYVTLTDGTWHHLVNLRGGATQTVYGDGGAVSASGACDTTALSTAAVVMGRSDPGFSIDLFDGFIDDVRIYNRALSPQEVASLYSDPLLEFHWAQRYLHRSWSFAGESSSSVSAASRIYQALVA